MIKVEIVIVFTSIFDQVFLPVCRDPVALQFWSAAQKDASITDHFKSICQQNIAVLKSLDDGPTMHF
ncbi:MAG: hypothetical protein L3J57_04210 [Desulfuromusa sp.]|nr:hypothetical protein [Desulfuromusa sp.]